MAKKQKIIYVITKANWGGAQKYVFELISSLPEDKFAISVVYGGEGVLAEKLRALGIQGVSIPGLWRDVKFGSDLKAFWQLWRLFKTEKPDIVHLNSSKIGGLGSLAARLAGVKKVVFTIHGWAFDEDRSWWQKMLIKMISWLTITLCHQTIAISKHSKDQTKNWPGKAHGKIKVIYNGIDTNADIKYKTRDDLGISTDSLIIGTIAELTKNKGLWYAVKAMKELKNRKIILFIVGDGEEREVIEGLVAKEGLEEKVVLLGFRDNAQNLLKVFDVFILPSLKEGLPYVLLEAGLAERPVIASNVGSIAEIITDNETGILIPPRDLDALTEAIDHLTGNAPKRTLLGRALREKIESDFSKNTMMDKTLSLYLD